MSQEMRPAPDAGLWAWGIGTVVFVVVGWLALAVLVSLSDSKRGHAPWQRCEANLRQLDGAKESWSLEKKKQIGDKVTMTDLVPEYIKVEPKCPYGGTYDLGMVGESPACSIAQHTLAFLGTPYPAPFSPATPLSLRLACRDRLRLIVAAKQYWAERRTKNGDALPKAKEIYGPRTLQCILRTNSYLLFSMRVYCCQAVTVPTCPAGGTYTIGPLGQNRKCSFPGHGL